MDFFGLFKKKDNSKLQSAIRKRKSVKTGVKLIKDGADVNYYNFKDFLDTPLHFACRLGHIEWVSMLLYHGADPNIPSQHGRLPITDICSNIPIENRIFLQKILRPYTRESKSLSLRTLAAVMREEEMSLFLDTIQNVTTFTYEEDEIEDFVQSVTQISGFFLKLFVRRFHHVLEDIAEDLILNGFLSNIAKTLARKTLSELGYYKEIFNFFLHRDCIRAMGFIDAEISVVCFYGGRIDLKRSSIISAYVGAFGGHSILSQEDITKNVLLMVSYGLKVTLLDLDTVFSCYGYCELFEILLHMDIENKYRNKVSLIVLLYFDPNLKIEYLFHNDLSIFFLLDYYNNEFLNKQCLSILKNHGLLFKVLQRTTEFGTFVNYSRNFNTQKVEGMPKVPLLIELSRNIARKYIIEKYRIKRSKHFYTVMNALPIDKLTKEILILRKKLY